MHKKDSNWAVLMLDVEGAEAVDGKKSEDTRLSGLFDQQIDFGLSVFAWKNVLIFVGSIIHKHFEGDLTSKPLRPSQTFYKLSVMKYIDLRMVCDRFSGRYSKGSLIFADSLISLRISFVIQNRKSMYVI